MSVILAIGTALGALVGLVHSVIVYGEQRSLPGRTRGRALLFAVWTVALWTIFGAYLLIFYLLGAALMALAPLFGRREPAS